MPRALNDPAALRLGDQVLVVIGQNTFSGQVGEIVALDEYHSDSGIYAAQFGLEFVVKFTTGGAAAYSAYCGNEVVRVLW